ncbi:MAG: permease [Culicoidibacterales bacterium]
MFVFQFLNDQLLKMIWLSDFISSVLNQLGLDLKSQVGSSVHFFIYDTIKIFILMSALIFIISYIQSFFPPERTAKILGGIKGIRGYIIGALFGTITPFCSCSSIPLFIGFTSSGLPIGVTFAFLISSPLVDLASFLMLASFFCFRFALAYVVIGLLLAIIGGYLIDLLHMEKEVHAYVLNASMSMVEGEKLTNNQRCGYAYQQVKDIIKKVYLYIFIGVGIGALIHNWIPTIWIEHFIGDKNPFAPIAATLFGMPVYADIFGTLPIAEALSTKGVGAGTIISFMMAVTALSIPSLVMLSKVVKPKLLATFIIIVTFGIICIGYLFNIII